MSVYTVHAPPLRAADALPDAERFAFVRDGFSLWAFLLAPLWMLWHRLWLVLASYVVVSAGLETALVAGGAPSWGVALVAVLISLLVGLEASTLRRLTLRRRGWKNVGIVSGDDLEDAERRFFDAWLRDAPSQQGASSAAAPAATAVPTAPMPRVPQAPDVIGLFPEPGARR
ncbi:MAG: DUF2628 domain-containing protein [Xanthobacteraceae bacterium]